jgi:hypothetical protein
MLIAHRRSLGRYVAPGTQAGGWALPRLSFLVAV